MVSPMGDVWDIFSKRRLDDEGRSRRGGSIGVELNDDEEVTLVMNVPWACDREFRVVLPGETAHNVKRMLGQATGVKAHRAKARDDHRKGLVAVVLWGRSRQGEPRVVRRCTAQMIDRTAFAVRLRIVGTADWLPLRTRLDGQEFDVHLATGEQVSHAEGRRYWQVESEHVPRLKDGGLSP